MDLVRKFVLFGVVVLTSSVSSAFAANEGLVVLEKHHDFGSVPQGAKVRHEFLLENKGDKEVQIQKITPSCGCTAATVDSSTIKPGEVGKVLVEFDTAGFSGNKTKTVQVLTSDLSAADIVLTMKGSVVPGVTAEPRRVEFGEISPGDVDDRWDREFSITLKEGSDLVIEKVASYSRFISVTQVGSNGLTNRYKVEISKDAPRGELRDRVVVQFAGDKQSVLNIPVTASIRGDMRLVPSTISFGVVEGSEIVERRVKWENVSKAKIGITDIESSHPAVSASFIEVKGGFHGVVVVKVDPSKLSGDLKATVSVHTTHPSEADLTLNVFGVEPPK